MKISGGDDTLILTAENEDEKATILLAQTLEDKKVFSGVLEVIGTFMLNKHLEINEDNMIVCSDELYKLITECCEVEKPKIPYDPSVA